MKRNQMLILALSLGLAILMSFDMNLVEAQPTPRYPFDRPFQTHEAPICNNQRCTNVALEGEARIACADPIPTQRAHCIVTFSTFSDPGDLLTECVANSSWCIMIHTVEILGAETN